MGTQNSGLLQAECLDVAVSNNPFGHGVEFFELTPGMTLGEILNETCPRHKDFKAVIFIGDHYIHPEYYDRVKPKPVDLITVNIAPHGGGGGGKNPLRTILSIALVAAAPYAAGALLGPGIIAGSAFGAQLITTGLTAAITGIGNLALNALIPPAQPRKGNINSELSGGSKIEESQMYFVQGARNRALPFGSVPEVLGTHRIVPPLAARTYNEVSASKIYARQMFCFSCGKIAVSDERLGNTSLSLYQGVESENFFDGNLNDPSSIMPGIVIQNDTNIELEEGDDWRTLTTALDTDEFELQFTFPRGLVYYNPDGVASVLHVYYEIRYAPTGTTDWTVAEFAEIRDDTYAFIVTKGFQVPRGQYDIGVRITNKIIGSGTLSFYDDMVWSALRSYQHSNPVLATGFSGKALKILGSGQLTGAVDDYNCLASRLIRSWDGENWVEDQITSNNAAIARHVLTSEYGRNPLSDDEYDIAGLERWFDFCEEQGFTYDSYLDYEADQEELLQEIAAAGRARFTIVDNKHTIIFDAPSERIVNHITQRKSYNYTYERVFQEPIHGFRCPFINAERDFLQDEIIVYADGYDSSNATRFEQLDFPGVVHAENIYKLARYHLAVLKLRPDMHKVTLYADRLVGTAGQRVKLSHDVALVGLGTGRVKSVILHEEDDTQVVGVTVDEEISLESGKTYSAEFWVYGGSDLTVGLVTNVGTSKTLTFATPVAISAAPQAGDLFSYGITDSVTIDCLIHSVIPNDEYSADVYLIRYAPEVYEAADGPIPVFDPGTTTPPEFAQPSPPVLVSVQSDESVQIENIDGSISNRMVITITHGNSGLVEPIITYRNAGEGVFKEADVVRATDSRIVLEGLEQGKAYDFEIRLRRIAGAVLGSNVISLPLNLNGVTFIGQSTDPPDVENFDITVRSDSVFLSWDKVRVIDLAGYELRFQPVTSGAAWESAIRVGPLRGKEDRSAVAPHRVGTYLIKAFDRTGNYSDAAAVVTTTVGQLDGLNAVATIEEHPSWSGTLNGTSVDAGVLQLGSDVLWEDLSGNWDSLGMWDYADGEIVNGGTYEFEGPDLGAVYTSVVSASFVVSGSNVSDFMDNVGLWDSRETWDGTDPSQYDVRLQIQTTNDDPAGSPTYSNWRDVLAIGEYTFRQARFRLVLSSRELNVTPLVSECVVTIDAPDRFESANNIASGTGGKRVDFANAFAEGCIPTVTFGINGEYDDMSFTADADGFDVEFFLSSVSVDLTFDYQARGFGRKSS